MPLQPKRLYIVLHGLYAFYQRKNDQEIDALMPDLREKRPTPAGGFEIHSPHVYKAGNWLAETTISPGAELRLQGVSKGPSRFDRFRNIIVEGPNRLSGVAPYAKLTFPQPLEVLTLREIDVKVGIDIIGKSIGRVPGNKLVATPVFRYEVEDETKLCLGNHPWVPAAVDGTITLHVFGEPEVPQGPVHSLYEFGKAFELFEDVDLRLATELRMPPLDGSIKLPPGLQLQELEDLVSRNRRLAAFARAQKSGGDLASAWKPDEVYGENPTACTGGGGDDTPIP